MGNLAGSGGYFVAMAANKIVAQPGTITGSIGVLGGKILTTGLWDKLGFTWDEVHTSANATLWSSTHDYTPEQWAHLQEWLDRVYNDFTTKVAAGRQLPKERVLEIAKGRIWTGEDAKERGGIFREVMSQLLAHSQAEQAVLYRKLEKSDDEKARSFAFEGDNEHQIVEQQLQPDAHPQERTPRGSVVLHGFGQVTRDELAHAILG